VKAPKPPPVSTSERGRATNRLIAYTKWALKKEEHTDDSRTLGGLILLHWFATVWENEHWPAAAGAAGKDR